VKIIGGSGNYSNSFSNSAHNFTISLGKTTYEVYKRIIRPDYTANKIAKALKLSRSTIKYHIDKLQKLRLIKCINPKERVKFYEKTVDVNATPGKRKGTYLLSNKKLDDLGRGSKYGSLQPTDSRHKKAIKNGDERYQLARVHAVSFKVPILEKWNEKYKDITWQKVSKPRGRFEQYTKKEKVKGIGDVSYKWIHTKNKDTLIVYLPMMYLLPHEAKEENIDQILTDYGWQAFKHFIKKYHVGVERLMEPVGKRHVAYPATEKQKQFIDKFGTIEVETPNGKMMIDDSMDDGGEVEADNINDIKLYNEVREDLLKPNMIYKMQEDISNLEDKMANINKKTESHDNFLKQFTENFHKYLDQEQKKWEEQKKFNKTVLEYMERTDGKIDRISREIGLEKIPTKQTTLKDMLSQKNKDDNIAYA
jgi:DNA-binding transcriptional ArsR family regulator